MVAKPMLIVTLRKGVMPFCTTRTAIAVADPLRNAGRACRVRGMKEGGSRTPRRRTRHQIARTMERRLDDGGDGPQAVVAGEMAVIVVEGLEAVHVEQEQAERRDRPTALLDLDGNRLVQGASIGDPCQSVDAGHRREVRLVSNRRFSAERRSSMARRRCSSLAIVFPTKTMAMITMHVAGVRSVRGQAIGAQQEAVPDRPDWPRRDSTHHQERCRRRNPPTEE